MPHSSRAVAAVEGAVAFFSQHEVASLKLPSGWFGRPFDNLHQLTEATIDDGETVLIRLDGTQTLTFNADRTSVNNRVLHIVIRGGRWRWTGYGGDTEHVEDLGPGVIEFHAPFTP